MKLKKFVKTLNTLYMSDRKLSGDTLDALQVYFSNIDTTKSLKSGIKVFDAYHKKNKKYYDIVFIDIKVSDTDIVDLCNAILAKNNTQRFIIISQNNTHIPSLQKLGIFNFVSLPIDKNYLKSNILQVASALQQQEVISQQCLAIKAIKKTLKSAQKKAEESSHQKSYFLANMSHEIRTPLNAIMGFITLLHEKETDEEKLKYLNILKTSSDALLQIINDILDITKIESGKLLIDKLPFDPYEKLVHTTELFQVAAAKKDVIFEVKANRSMPDILIGDAFRIKQIVSNLLSNAIKFTPSGSRVKCVIWYKKGILHIKVKDYGIGIVKEKHKYIFEAFHQADNTMATEYGGTGLGLALSTELARLLGGTLTFKDNKAGGSIFTLSIKIPSGDKESLPAKKEPEDHSNTTLEGHVLIVDDVEANRIFLSIILDNLSLTYDMAENGLEAIERFGKSKYDLILMDENMPRLNGSKAAKKIKSLEKKLHQMPTPIIMLTANALKGDKERFLKAGLDGYLSKPVEPHTLISTLKKYL